MKLLKLIANLGYGSRKEVTGMFRDGRITDANGEVLYADDQVEHASIRVDGEPLDPSAGLLLMLNCCRHAFDCVRQLSPALAGWTATPAACC
jgi:16S rRNA pseudouridine516 synthase